MSTDASLTLIGVVLCAVGWFALWFGTRLVGAVIGLGLGFCFGVLFSLVLGIAAGSRELVELSCAAVGALGGIIFIRAVTSFVLAFTGFLFGVLVGRLAIDLYASAAGIDAAASSETILVAVGCGVVGAILALWLRRAVVIFVTAFVGSTFLCAGVAFLHDTLPWSFAAIFAGSCFLQTSLAKLFRRRPVNE